MGPLPANAELCVLLTPRELGGHEAALLGWLRDAVADGQLRPAIVAPTTALADALAAAGLGHCRWPQPAGALSLLGWLRLLRSWPADRPLLLAPGTVHAQAWLLAAAVALRRQVWVYLPMAFDGRTMGLRQAALRDALLAPWLRLVSAWITLDARQRHWLHGHWGVAAPVHLLPNIARLPALPAPGRRPAPDERLRVAFVGRFDLAQKGLDWLAATLRGPHKPWCSRYRWLFQGRGPGEAALLTLASTLGPQHVEVRSHAPLAQALADSDVLLLPSRYEGLPLVALEATALGWPVVASRAAGLERLLPERSLFEFGDEAGLRRALESVRRPADRSAAVAHARRCLAAWHDSGHYRPALARLVHALRAGAAGRPC